MREIKFRAWDRESLKMSPAFHLFGEFTLMGAVHTWQEDYRKTKPSNCLLALNDLVIMQYTGLKDANGVEIYEGDVVYLSGIGNTVMKFPFIDLYEAGCEQDIGKVIGNIYQNPELLEDKQHDPQNNNH